MNISMINAVPQLGIFYNVGGSASKYCEAYVIGFKKE